MSCTCVRQAALFSTITESKSYQNLSFVAWKLRIYVIGFMPGNVKGQLKYTVLERITPLIFIYGLLFYLKTAHFRTKIMRGFSSKFWPTLNLLYFIIFIAGLSISRWTSNWPWNIHHCPSSIGGLDVCLGLAGSVCLTLSTPPIGFTE